MNVAIKIENLSKQYRLGLVSTRTLSHDLNRWWQTSILGREDPYLKVGQENKLSTNNSQLTIQKSSEYIWALNDINLEVEEGEVLGIIGKNGAGKSTLLKILSKVTSPTTGAIKARGRIASLLEVGTGFHQEMTGRENIFMNGAIMGMTKAEIRKKFDEIVDFAGVERYIDTPVKRYSSGMTVRLGFSVAAHLEPEILVVDEVLAVGDAEFQKKAIGKMQDVSGKEGRTVLFVSHNMSAVRNLCQKAILLENGNVGLYDCANIVVQYYLSSNINSTTAKYWHFDQAPSNQHAKILSVKLADINGELLKELNTEIEIFVEIDYYILNDNEYVGLTMLLLDGDNNIIFSSINNHEKEYYGKPLRKGCYRSICMIPLNFLNSISYSIDIILFSRNYTSTIRVSHVLAFNLEDKGFLRKDYFGGFEGVIRPLLNWRTIKIN